MHTTLTYTQRIQFKHIIREINMRTTLNIDDTLMSQLLESTHQKSKTKAITIAIKDYLMKKQIKKIHSY